jgi:hypothetical protein
MKKAFVELSSGTPVRIFRNRHAAMLADFPTVDIQIMPYRQAVSTIRLQIWNRTKGECEWCSKPISEQSMHMHEMVSRGDGGEISLVNSVGICYDCHFGPAGHGNRVTRFGETDEAIF